MRFAIFCARPHEGFKGLLYGRDDQNNPSHGDKLTRRDRFLNKYCSGSPRLPKTSIVINDPVLQQGPFLNNVFTGAVIRIYFKLAYNACSLPRFHVLLKML